MAKEKQLESPIEQIGAIAGTVWETLSKDGEMTLTALGKEIDAPRDVVMQAVGWLAREGKINIQRTGQKRIISLN